jgi:hypothetical protein
MFWLGVKLPNIFIYFTSVLFVSFWDFGNIQEQQIVFQKNKNGNMFLDFISRIVPYTSFVHYMARQCFRAAKLVVWDKREVVTPFTIYSEKRGYSIYRNTCQNYIFFIFI